MFSLTNMVMLGVPLLVTALLWWRFPRKYGEVRPSTQCLMLGAPLFILGLYALWVQLSSGEPIQAVMAAGLCLGAAAAIAFWLRERLYFKRHIVFRLVWRELRGMIAYRDMERVELTGDGLRVLMKDKTSWMVPGTGDAGQVQDVITRSVSYTHLTLPTTPYV